MMKKVGNSTVLNKRIEYLLGLLKNEFLNVKGMKDDVSRIEQNRIKIKALQQLQIRIKGQAT